MGYPCANVDPSALVRSMTSVSSQQRLLENELKLARWTDRVGESRFQMLESLEKWIVPSTVGRSGSATEVNTQAVQAAAQSLEQMINRLQGGERFDLMESRPDRSAGQHSRQDLPEGRGADRVSGQNVIQEDRKGVSTASALAPIGAEDSLAANRVPIRLGAAVPEQETVPVKRLRRSALSAAVLFEETVAS